MESCSALGSGFLCLPLCATLKDSANEDILMCVLWGTGAQVDLQSAFVGAAKLLSSVAVLVHFH
jgi:hypothetical protein